VWQQFLEFFGAFGKIKHSINKLREYLVSFIKEILCLDKVD